MRIIAGEARGRRLQAPKTKDTRPVTDRAREAVFSSLGEVVLDAEVADLYAGSGSFGLEALSRGARSATFVENARKALVVLQANIEAVGLGGVVVDWPVRRFLTRSETQFDLIFMDPPWPQPTETMESELGLLDRLLYRGGEVVVTRRHSDRVPGPPGSWRVVSNKLYGDTRVLRYVKPEVCRGCLDGSS